MLANLPLIPCTHAEFLSVLTMRSSILAAAWLSETFAENGSVTTNWRLASSVAIGTTAISEYSPRSRRCASKSACPCSSRTRSGQSCKSSPVMGWRAAPLWAREYALRARASGASKHRARPNRAETEAWSLQMKAYGGPAQPSPTIGQCLNGGFAWLEIECKRCKTRASLPLAAIRRPRNMPIWKLAAALKCRSCRQRELSPVAMPTARRLICIYARKFASNTVHARGIPISSDDAFFHFGGGMAVRNLCRERLSDDQLAACQFGGDWDNCYIGVLAAIAAMRQ